MELRSDRWPSLGESLEPLALPSSTALFFVNFSVDAIAMSGGGNAKYLSFRVQVPSSDASQGVNNIERCSRAKGPAPAPKIKRDRVPAPDQAALPF